MNETTSLEHIHNNCDPIKIETNNLYKSNRIIGKLGNRNVRILNIPQRSIKYVNDFVTTLIDGRWRYTLTVIALVYLSTWTFFALLYMLIAYEHGDFELDPLTGKHLHGNLPCIIKANGFIGYFIMSIDAQTTIGFGAQYPHEECPQGIYLLSTQMMLAIAIEGAMISIFYSKLTRPPKRTRDYKFSKHAVVCMRDGKLNLVFQIADQEGNHAIATKVEAFLFDKKRSAEGEELEHFQQSLVLENNGEVTLLWPQTISHLIDENSPLYKVSSNNLKSETFQIALSITGTSRSTAQITQARTSYLTTDILWGQRFVNIIIDDENRKDFIANFGRFDETESVIIPRQSAYDLNQLEAVNMLQNDSELLVDKYNIPSTSSGIQ